MNGSHGSAILSSTDRNAKVVRNRSYTRFKHLNYLDACYFINVQNLIEWWKWR